MFTTHAFVLLIFGFGQELHRRQLSFRLKDPPPALSASDLAEAEKPSPCSDGGGLFLLH